MAAAGPGGGGRGAGAAGPANTSVAASPQWPGVLMAKVVMLQTYFSPPWVKGSRRRRTEAVEGIQGFSVSILRT